MNTQDAVFLSFEEFSLLREKRVVHPEYETETLAYNSDDSFQYCMYPI